MTTSSALACPACKRNIVADSAHCAGCGAVWSKAARYLDFLGGEKPSLTPAQASNLLPSVASGYELWRGKSLSMVSGQYFPLPSELALMTLLAPPRGAVLDLACSTALYARHLASQRSVEKVYALDLAPAMLDHAHRQIFRDGLTGRITLLRALAQALPFGAATLNGIYCGGSLNEMGAIDRVLGECQRVLAPGGVFFFMALLEAQSVPGGALQRAAGAGGLEFFDPASVTEQFEANGLAVSTFERYGAVGFLAGVRGA